MEEVSFEIGDGFEYVMSSTVCRVEIIVCRKLYCVLEESSELVLKMNVKVGGGSTDST